MIYYHKTVLTPTCVLIRVSVASRWLRRWITILQTRSMPIRKPIPNNTDTKSPNSSGSMFGCFFCSTLRSMDSYAQESRLRFNGHKNKNVRWSLLTFVSARPLSQVLPVRRVPVRGTTVGLGTGTGSEVLRQDTGESERCSFTLILQAEVNSFVS